MVANLLNEMGIVCNSPTVLFEDNNVAEEPREHKRMKHIHIDVKYNSVHDTIASKEVDVKYIPSNDQTTKSLGF